MRTDERARRDTVRAWLAIVLGLVVLGLFIVVLGGFRFWEDLALYQARFRNVQDVGPGRPVKYAGLEVGRVLGTRIDPADPAYVLVDLGVEADFPIPAGTVASITQKGLVGDTFILLRLEAAPGISWPSREPSGRRLSRDAIGPTDFTCVLSGKPAF